MKIQELIDDLLEIKSKHGDIKVLTDSELGLCELSTRNDDNEFNIVKRYQTLSGHWDTDDFKIKDDDLHNVDLNVDIEKLMII